MEWHLCAAKTVFKNQRGKENENVLLVVLIIITSILLIILLDSAASRTDGAQYF